MTSSPSHAKATVCPLLWPVISDSPEEPTISRRWPPAPISTNSVGIFHRANTLLLQIRRLLRAPASQLTAKAFAWGDNSFGKLGNNCTTQSTVPVAVNATGALAGKTITAVSTGTHHSLALCSDGTLATWGANPFDQGIENTTTQSGVPMAVNTSGVLVGKTVIAVSAGASHSLAMCADGTVAAWGYNRIDHLGIRSASHSHLPVAISEIGFLAGKTVVAIAAGGYHSLALCSDGSIAAWGQNEFGQLGNDSTAERLEPVAVDPAGVLVGKTVIAVSAGASYSLALCSDGTLAAWGQNYFGQLGNDSMANSHMPVAVDQTGVLAGKTITAISAGAYHSLALCADGTLVSWGCNCFGQLGNNSKTSSPEQVPVAVDTAGAIAGKTVTSISAGASHSLALCSDGTLAAWGYKSGGQLGNRSSLGSCVPIAVSTLPLAPDDKFVAIATGSNAFHTMALVGSNPSSLN